MQRGPLRPRSRPPLRPLAVCIKCTHGGLSMPAAGLTLKMRESKAWDRVKCWFGICPTWPKGRKQGRGTSPRALSKLKAAADEQQRVRGGGRERGSTGGRSSCLVIDFHKCRNTFLLPFSALFAFDWPTDWQAEAGRQSRPGTRNRIHYGLAQLICIACHMPNKQTTISNGLLVISRFDFCDVKFLFCLCFSVCFNFYWVHRAARGNVTSRRRRCGAAACVPRVAVSSSLQLHSGRHELPRSSRTLNFSLSPFAPSLVSKGELELCLGLATRKE